MRLAAVVLIASAAATQTSDCNQPIGEIKQTSNPKVQVELLFEHEGCRGYVVNGAYRTFYYVRCPEATRVEWQTQTHTQVGTKGAKTTQTHHHETVTVKP